MFEVSYRLLFVSGVCLQSSRHYCLLLLASVCRVNAENLRRLRHEQGVVVLLEQLARCKEADPTLPSAYTVRRR